MVLPLSFSNGDSDACPPGYSTFGVSGIDSDGKEARCVFPFRFNGTLFYECITQFEDRVNPWCSTTNDYDKDKRWAYCLDVKCFRFIDDDPKTYIDARKSCLNDRAYLASIHNELEQSNSFIKVKLKYVH